MLNKILKTIISLLLLITALVVILFFNMDFKSLKNISIDKTYVINLDRSINRYSQMQKKLKNYPFPYERFSAINGRNILFTDLANNKEFSGDEAFNQQLIFSGNYSAKCNEDTMVQITNINEKKYNKRIPGEIGLICSGKIIWQNIVKNKYQNTLILEDDIILRPYFDLLFKLAIKYVPRDYDLLLLSYKPYGNSFVDENDKYMLNALKENQNHIFWRSAKKNIMSSQAYILSLEGAKKILQCEQENISRTYLPVDVIQRDCNNRGNLKTYALTPKAIWFDHSNENISDITLLKEIDKN